uniref:Uncharacterized protein n=1 Tax=Rhizophora mucronata TaxID=61149 RepID=A0A2P2QRF2_RHIMU
MALNINKLLNIGIIDQQPKLVQLKLNLLKNLLLEIFSSLEDLLHGHRSRKNAGLPFDNPLNELVNMVGMLVISRNQLCVKHKAFHVGYARADSEHGGEDERQLLGAHGLNLERVVHRRDVEA